MFPKLLLKGAVSSFACLSVLRCGCHDFCKELVASMATGMRGFCLYSLFCSALALGEQHLPIQLAIQIYFITFPGLDCMGSLVLSSTGES